MDVAELIQQFRRTKSLFSPDKFSVTTLDDDAYRVRPNVPKGEINARLLMSGVVHGDEIGNLCSFVEIAKMLSNHDDLRVEVTFALGNTPAASSGKRYIDMDLNQCFNVDEQESVEQKLADRLEALVEQADYVIDFHQSVQPTETGFFIFPYTADNLRFARQICGDNPLITYPEDQRDGSMNLDLYALIRGKIGLTFETGGEGIAEDQIKNAREVAQRAVNALSITGQPSHPNPRLFTMSEAKIEAKPGRKLCPGIKNFMHIQPGNILAEGPDGSVRSPTDGYILFPTYGKLAKEASSLCQFVRPMELAETTTW